MPLFPGEPKSFLTVSELNQLIKGTLERELDPFWVVGEISNFRLPPSGHIYFTLKDNSSQVAAVMFRHQGQNLSFQLENGMKVLCFGRVSLYPVRGDLQLYVEMMEPRGRGVLYLAFEQLKAKLDREGLFAAERKRPLPYLPRGIGIVTSLQGAVIRDMLRVFRDRFPARRVVIRPAKVQGDGAAQDIAEGIAELGRSGLVEVIIVGRGGGSLEDLWAFNEEVVARAIFASPVPVVSAVGHEVDFTIADFVADHRAPTPTAAAGAVIPRKDRVSEQIQRLGDRLCRIMAGRLQSEKEIHQALRRRLIDPRRRLRDHQMRLDELSISLWRRFEDRVNAFRERLRQTTSCLDALSPLAVLQRGYSIAHKMPEEILIKESDAIEVGEVLRLTFARGKALCRVEGKE